MAAIKLGDQKTVLNITPWFDSGYVFKELEMQEEIGNRIANGVVKLTSDGTNLGMIVSQNTLTITFHQEVWQNKSVDYTITGWIYMRKHIENEAHLYFVAIPDNDFTITSKVAKYKIGIKKTIKALYPGKKKFLDVNDVELEPDVPGNLDSLDQNGMNSFDFCSKLCRSYRKDAVYSFGLEGLFIKSIYRKPFIVYGESDCANTDMHDIMYHKEMDLDSKQRDKSVNISARMYGAKYEMTRGDFHSKLLSIYQYNERYTTNLKCQLKLRFLTRIPEFKIGDIIEFKNKISFNEGKRYIVTFIRFTIKGNEVLFDCQCSSWQDVSINA